MDAGTDTVSVLVPVPVRRETELGFSEMVTFVIAGDSV